MERTKDLPGPLGGGLRDESSRAHHQPQPAARQIKQGFPLATVGVNVRLVWIGFKQRTDRVMRGKLRQVDPSQANRALVDGAPVALLGQIAMRGSQQFDELVFHFLPRQPLIKLHYAPRVLDDLLRLNARQIVEEPAATGVHQQGVALHFQQLPKQHLIRFGDRPQRTFGKEVGARFRRPVEHYFDIGIARFPGILDDGPRQILVSQCRLVAQPVQGLAQRATPFLVPTPMSAARAAAVAFPTAHAMSTTP